MGPGSVQFHTQSGLLVALEHVGDGGARLPPAVDEGVAIEAIENAETPGLRLGDALERPGLRRPPPGAAHARWACKGPRSVRVSPLIGDQVRLVLAVTAWDDRLAWRRASSPADSGRRRCARRAAGSRS